MLTKQRLGIDSHITSYSIPTLLLSENHFHHVVARSSRDDGTLDG